MPNRLLEQLRTQHAELSAQYDDVLNRCADEGRDPSDAEAGILEGLTGQLGPLGERIVTLRSADDRRLATMNALDNYPQVGDAGTGSAGGDRMPVVHVRADELVYRRDGGPDGTQGFFRDLVATREGDRDAGDRIERHQVQMRAMGSTVGGAGVVPPVWLPEEFAALARGARPIADTFRRVPITSAAPVTVGVQTSGALVGTQPNEGDPASDGNFTADPLVTTPKTKSGKIDVSRQLVDGSNPAVDAILYGDLMGAYMEQVELEAVTALSIQTGIAASVPVDTTTETIVDGISHGATAVRTGRKRQPTHVYMTHVGYGALTREKDAAGRPLITTGRYGPMNAQGLADPTQYDGVAGDVLGLLVVPSWAGVDGNMYVARADDLLLLESATLTFRYEEVVGPEQIRLGVWGYVAAVTGRYPKGIAKLIVTPTPTGFGSDDDASGDDGSGAKDSPTVEAGNGRGRNGGGK